MNSERPNSSFSCLSFDTGRNLPAKRRASAERVAHIEQRHLLSGFFNVLSPISSHRRPLADVLRTFQVVVFGPPGHL